MDLSLMINEKQTILRLLLAAFLGACIGYERERRNQPAGLRTHTILSIGSALAMCISIDLAMEFRSLAPNGDPARLAAQVVSGIGFLGAGAIIKFGANIKGLTTATSLWTVAIVGLAVGAGHFFAGVATTALLLITLSLLNICEKKWIEEIQTRTVKIKALDRQNFVNELKKTFAEHHVEIKSISIAKNVETNEIEIDSVAKISNKQNMDELIGTLSNIREIKLFEVD